MKNIDSYILKTKGMDGGTQRTKAYVFEEDGVILVKKSEKNFEDLKNKIKLCKDKGINIPAYIDYKCDGENNWILEELAPGDELASLVDDDNITKIFGDMPYEHIKKYIHDVYLLRVSGIGVEPRRRNIFYDKEKGFTTIDVALLNKCKEQDSLQEVNTFFSMFSSVCLPPFSNDEYGKYVREKTILNIIRAFESEHPFFEKYKRWIYRGNIYFANFLQKYEVNLTLDEEESKLLENYINELIDSIVQEKIADPKTLFFNYHTSYIDLLNSSIKYCESFNLFNIKEQTLGKYITDSVWKK